MLTRTGVRGAVIDPIRPTIDENARRLWRYSVGYNSDVNKYRDVITMEIPNLPNKKIISRTTVKSETEDIFILYYKKLIVNDTRIIMAYGDKRSGLRPSAQRLFVQFRLGKMTLVTVSGKAQR